MARSLRALRAKPPVRLSSTTWTTRRPNGVFLTPLLPPALSEGAAEVEKKLQTRASHISALARREITSSPSPSLNLPGSNITQGRAKRRRGQGRRRRQHGAAAQETRKRASSSQHLRLRRAELQRSSRVELVCLPLRASFTLRAPPINRHALSSTFSNKISPRHRMKTAKLN